jgi:signal transduction histidine kinase
MKLTSANGLRIATKINALTGLGAVVALTGVWVLLDRTQVRNEAHEQALVSLMGQMDLARRTQVDFKKQVQEWKDILLRGYEQADLEKYRTQFLHQEHLVREDGEALSRLLEPPDARELLAEFLRAHADLGVRYRNALDVFVSSGGSNYRSADRLVRGMDRPPTNMIDTIVASIARALDERKAVHAAAFARERRDTALAVAGLFLALLIAGVLSAQRIVVAPVHSLTRIMSSVSISKDYSLRAVRSSRDELGVLTDGFNELLSQIQRQTTELETSRAELETRVIERTRELENMHKQLRDVAHQAGMAEVATNVLHNVGNVLNSVNVSANLLAQQAHTSEAGGLARVVKVLREHQHDLATFITGDARGQHLVTHLGNLAEHLQAERAAVVQEVGSLQANIEHIKDIVTMQQGYARMSCANEIVGVTDLVEDSLRLNAGALVRHRVEVIRDFQDRPMVNLDKHRVLQILVNLVRNAKYACEESHCAEPRVTLRVAVEEGRACISVIDNGVGIAPENLSRIFKHGFTTRASGHGFGLYSAVLAARELGGSLSVHSEGLGRGATFTLELPLLSMQAGSEAQALRA